MCMIILGCLFATGATIACMCHSLDHSLYHMLPTATREVPVDSTSIEQLRKQRKQDKTEPFKLSYYKYSQRLTTAAADSALLQAPQADVPMMTDQHKSLLAAGFALDKLEVVTCATALGQFRVDEDVKAMLRHEGDASKREKLLNGCVTGSEAYGDTPAGPTAVAGCRLQEDSVKDCLPLMLGQ